MEIDTKEEVETDRKKKNPNVTEAIERRGELPSVFLESLKIPLYRGTASSL